MQPVQLAIFVLITALIGLATWWQCRKAVGGDKSSGHDYFLANGGLNWYFVAGSITLTNLSTDQLVGMNGNQMLLIVWWELAAVFGLFVLTYVFLPIYYRNDCTTTTELLQKKYGNKHIRALISLLFLLGNLFIFLPAILYGGALFLKSMTGIEVPLLAISIAFAVAGACYAILGGLRAVAVSDTFSGFLILSLAVLVAVLAMKAINFDFSGIPAERLTLFGGNDSPIPWHTLFTGMIFIQIFYWSTNQTITQRAMASPSLKEGQKGVLVAALVRFLIIPAIVVIPGIVAFKLYGDINDAAYGRIVGDVLPAWLSGAFAAGIAAAVLTTFNSILNSSAALYVCDLHEPYIGKIKRIPRVSAIASIVMTILAIALVPIFATQESIINTVQQLYGLLSMPILSAFIVGLAFKNVEAWAAIIAVVIGVAFYAFMSFVWTPVHYIHAMAITLVISVFFALLVNLVVFGRRAQLVFFEKKDPLADAVE